MATPSVQLLETSGLAVRFAFQQDRYAHEILLADGARWIPILKSVEGSPAEDWPASPPLQSLHVESRPGNRQLAFLVGMAGHSHWSMSVELDPAQARITFDVACRAHGGPVGHLGSRYRMESVPSEIDTRRALLFPPAFPGIGLEFEYGDPLSCRCSSFGPDAVELLPVTVPGDGPRTVRWSYRVQCRDRSERV